MRCTHSPRTVRSDNLLRLHCRSKSSTRDPLAPGNWRRQPDWRARWAEQCRVRLANLAVAALQHSSSPVMLEPRRLKATKTMGLETGLPTASQGSKRPPEYRSILLIKEIILRRVGWNEPPHTQPKTITDRLSRNTFLELWSTK